MNAPPRWWQRSWSRLAAACAVGLLGIVTVTTYWKDSLLRQFGLPGRMEWEDRHEAEHWANLLYGDRWNPDREAPVFSKQARQRLDQALRDADRAAVWLDRDGKVVFVSSGLPWARGAAPAVAELAAARLPDGRAARAQVIVAQWLGRPAGAVWLWLPDEWRRPAVAGAGIALPPALERAMLPPGIDAADVVQPLDFGTEFHARMRQAQERFALAVVIGVPIVSAVLLGLIVAWTMTRRLRRLTQQVADPQALSAAIRIHGRDEIAFLAHEIERLRGRVAGLVGDLERRDRQRREWIAQVSHDLRTPLTALVVCLERLQADGALADADRQELLRAACTDGARLHELIDDLFELARLDAGVRLRPEDIMPEELVGQAVRALRPLAAASGVALELHVDGVLPTLRGDGHLLKRALENLVRNAIRHAHSRVQVTLAGGVDQIRFLVRDDGPGMPSDGEITPSTTTGELRVAEDSAGLGLRVTAQVAAVHGGRLLAARAPGGGAELAIEVPLAS